MQAFFVCQPQMNTLILTGNPITNPFAYTQGLTLTHLQKLHLSRLLINKQDLIDIAQLFPYLTDLDLSFSRLDDVTDVGFYNIKTLQVLNLEGCPLTYFGKEIFQGLKGLRMLKADNYKLCCGDVLPQGFNPANCDAPQDELSSCTALLQSDFYRISLAVLCCLVLVGNLVSFVYRTFFSPATKSSFGVLVSNLCVSDLLMGVYLAFIGLADRLYMGSYVWEDNVWKGSTACHIAGFISLLSNEVSAFNICLITLDRFLVIRFPLRFRIHFI